MTQDVEDRLAIELRMAEIKNTFSPEIPPDHEFQYFHGVVNGVLHVELVVMSDEGVKVILIKNNEDGLTTAVYSANDMAHMKSILRNFIMSNPRIRPLLRSDFMKTNG